ncbi:KaiB domain protein [Chloroherpeton thalassium ATCC 35110]|uniref:KaiB domain protein n=1 Tax=Chloroherpeton thalassium (strain ATCC 35110 / GB-78) TaxID=517418 RepID=B3QSF6_CHLT3|nr:circadian clock KaiB family protein [Chloroherpeton thalassium]ACF12547.1 KaiB domain protein [Chloroherpeton thalassium ATCC 35110]
MMNDKNGSGASAQSTSIALRLYVLGDSVKTNVAINNLKQICEAHFPGMYQLEIYDVLENPQLLENDNVLATPLLIKLSPEPKMRIIGDFSDSQRVLQGLGYNPDKL